MGELLGFQDLGRQTTLTANSGKINHYALHTSTVPMQSNPDFYNPIQYSVIKQGRFLHHFAGIEKIQINYSQLHQDMFILAALNGKTKGTYLEIGAHEPIFISNTYLLESLFGWRGVSIELNRDMVLRHKAMRTNRCLLGDATTADYSDILDDAAMPSVIDYLSIDIDPPKNSLKALKEIPHDRYQFRVITFENDYSTGGHLERSESRELLQSLGYKLIVSDVSWGNRIIEDWWIHPDHINSNIIVELTCNDSNPHEHDKYIYGFYKSKLYALPAQPESEPLQTRLPSLCIEGWRSINHSYCLVNQWQILNILAHPIELRHRDISYYRPEWKSDQDQSGFEPEKYNQIISIPHPDEDDSFDVTYRISFPCRLSSFKSKKLFVFGTSQVGNVDGFFTEVNPEVSSFEENIRIITPSHWSRQGFIRSGFRDDTVKVISHGVDPFTFFPLDAELRTLYRELFGIKPDDYVLLSVSALTENKGIDVLLRAFLTLKQTKPELKLIVKRPGNLYGISLQQYLNKIFDLPELAGLSESHLNDVIEITDNFDFDGMRALYNACDAYISPYKAEGFNLPPLEASACGLPILVTQGGATDDYFDPKMGLQVEATLIDSAGQMFLEPDLDSLIDGIEKFAESRSRWGGSCASEYVHKEYNWSKVTDDLLKEMGLI
jgi:glycosyltransferase involved in cell wall biosynthesis